MSDIFQILIGSASAYLLGMSFVGYACILMVIKDRVPSNRKNAKICRCLAFFHYILGMLAVGAVPIIAYGRLRGEISVQSVTSFILMSIVMIGIIILAIRWINSKSESN